MTTAVELNDQQLLQYSRQIMLPQIDVVGQQRLMNANVLVLGAGGLGCPALFYLVTAGIGGITIVDHDNIDVSNMHRQILYNASDIGLAKANVACEKLQQFNTQASITAIAKIPDENELLDLVDHADLVIDGTDNFAARYRHNQVCFEKRTLLISGAVVRFEGQVTAFDPKDHTSPCYHCLYPSGQDEDLNCSENGVLGPVAGMIGTTMATEAIKLITGIGESLVGRLLLLDALSMQWRVIKLRKDPHCSVCAQG